MPVSGLLKGKFSHLSFRKSINYSRAKTHKANVVNLISRHQRWKHPDGIPFSKEGGKRTSMIYFLEENIPTQSYVLYHVRNAHISGGLTYVITAVGTLVPPRSVGSFPSNDFRSIS